MSQECPRRVFFRDEDEGSAMPGRGRTRRQREPSNSRARKATKSFTSAPGGTGGWFELHQLKKAVPQKFHNAASRRVGRAGEGSGGGGGRGTPVASNVRAFAAFPRFRAARKALSFVRALPVSVATDNDRARRDLGISRN